jgi:hypothetical protein
MLLAFLFAFPPSYTSLADTLRTNLNMTNSFASNVVVTMSAAEASALLMHMLNSKVHSYLEWGSGGSTEMISFLMANTTLFNTTEAYSIESSTKWMQNLRIRSPTIVHAEEQGLLHFIHGDIGRTGHLGFPKERMNASKALNYVRSISKHHRYDLILVDGRFRVACALQARHHMHNHSVLLIHDYGPNAFSSSSAEWANARRKEYRLVESFFELITIVDSLASFRIRAHTDQIALRQAFHRALLSAV